MGKKNTADEFIDGADPFDPIVAEEHEDRQKEERSNNSVDARRMLDRRRQAYTRVFGNPALKADIDIVLADLMWFCRANAPTFDKRDGEHADILSRIKEGRREVFTRIQHFSRLNVDKLLLMYTDAITKQ